ncbi:3-phosphoshikimate 1-carboxyvinyltransferase [Balneolaceae bacterium YR4-1]|uniref:3-phosphoshikimate 1-carboxyvinyltransferase n=1 Tax=Halalkalibaculum roseum TaxID=2709311 RepID=A0A6M1T803_9BACT|nr:3-phosphoshikimate 1-carboxyvinyltransferase [Halalkalibaculum roseum]NGP78075.1 3-phosphoshikimate 1-carboxyvinyltransferase [Halalkalibaculum roseum]
MSSAKEVKPAKNIKGTVELPADKSISHRAALFAALHESTSHISNFSAAADPQSTLACLRQLGIEIEAKGQDLSIKGKGRYGFNEPEEPLDCGNSGTTMRLLSGIVGGAGVNCTLTGDESLSARTMKRIIDPLRAMGIDIYGREDNFAPLKISRKDPVKALHFELPIPSAQLKSCVLLAGLYGKNTTSVIETIPSRDHTERLLQLPIELKKDRKIIGSDNSMVIPEQSYRIPNDFSAAAFWLVAGSIHKQGSVRLTDVGINPSRTAALKILQKMGAEISMVKENREAIEPFANLHITGSTLQPVTITEKLVPNLIDEIPILAIAMLFAEGTSTIRGAEELRHKETDRLSALSDMLKKAGASFKEMEDGLEIHGDPKFVPRPASYNSYHDHRIAMSAAILASKGSEPSKVKGGECTDISYPGFWEDLKMLTN